MLDIEDLAFRGLGVGRASGKVYFVPFTVPGDRVRIYVQKDLGSYGFATAIRFHEVSRDRIDPPCPLFGRCGGCQLQHIRYEHQTAWKRKWVTDHLRKIGGIADPVVEPVVTGPELFGYRNKASVHYEDDRMGFLERASRSLVDVPHCLLLDAAAHGGYEAVRTWIHDRAPHGQRRRILIRSGLETGLVIIHDPSVDREGFEDLTNRLPDFIVDRGGSRETIRQRVCGIDFEIGAESFFQVNGSLQEAMIDVIGERVNSGGILVDAHAGVGWPSLCLADRFHGIEGLDISKRSVSLANRNAEKAQIPHAHYQWGTIHSLAPRGRVKRAPDCLLCDPPRRGIDTRDMNAIRQLLPRRIVYISCDPATCARDVGRFVRHGYDLNTVTPVDLFPQTFHVETVAVLTRGVG